MANHNDPPAAPPHGNPMAGDDSFFAHPDRPVAAREELERNEAQAEQAVPPEAKGALQTIFAAIKRNPLSTLGGAAGVGMLIAAIATGGAALVPILMIAAAGLTAKNANDKTILGALWERLKGKGKGKGEEEGEVGQPVAQHGPGLAGAPAAGPVTGGKPVPPPPPMPARQGSPVSDADNQFAEPPYVLGEGRNENQVRAPNMATVLPNPVTLRAQLAADRLMESARTGYSKMNDEEKNALVVQLRSLATDGPLLAKQRALAQALIAEINRTIVPADAL